ncbi:MAG: DinB family protein [Chitinophagaceae bacterium]
MLIEVLRNIFKRDLDKLEQEISAYAIDANLWVVEQNIANSGGNLCLHLIGNLKTFIGKELGGFNYTRDRDAEFATKGVERGVLLAAIVETREMVDSSLAKLEQDDLSGMFPVQVFSERTTIEYMLVHLATHLTYHLGQINYHRRLLDHD